MLATFVIGLREGLEAALIVGIIAAFLKQSGRTGALRSMWIGVGAAVLVCLGVGIGLQALNQHLPQRQQEMLEAVVAAVAVAMVSAMILWMRRHSRNLRGELRTAAEGALAAGGATALVVMAFLAVFREGFETAVFLLAAFQASGSAGAAVAGAALGIAVALVLGWLIYRGGIKLNLSRFFRITGVVLVFVAGGLVISALRGAHEAAWITIGQQTAVELTGIITPGGVPESLLTGVLGIRSTLPVIEVGAWLLYVVPMLLVVVWPARWQLTAQRRALVLGTVAVVSAVVGLLLMLVVRPVDATGPVAVDLTGTMTAGTDPITGLDLTGETVTVAATVDLAADRSSARLVLHGAVTADGTTTLTLVGHDTVAGRDASVLTGTPLQAAATDLPTALTRDQVIALNGGRLPVGAGTVRSDSTFGATWTDLIEPTVLVQPSGSDLLGLSVDLRRRVDLTTDAGRTLPGGDVAAATLTIGPGRTDELLATADGRAADQARAQVLGVVVPWLLLVFAAVVAAFALAAVVRARRESAPAEPELVGAENPPR